MPDINEVVFDAGALVSFSMELYDRAYGDGHLEGQKEAVKIMYPFLAAGTVTKDSIDRAPELKRLLNRFELGDL